MNKLLASAAFAALALASGSAYAADANGSVDVGGTVPTCCTWSGGNGTASLVIPNFVNTSAQVNAGNTVGTNLGTVTCSGPAYVRVKTTTGGLKNAAAPGAACDANGNSTCVNYAAVAQWSAAGTPTATLPDSDGVAWQVRRLPDSFERRCHRCCSHRRDAAGSHLQPAAERRFFHRRGSCAGGQPALTGAFLHNTDGRTGNGPPVSIGGVPWRCGAALHVRIQSAPVSEQ